MILPCFACFWSSPGRPTTLCGAVWHPDIASAWALTLFSFWDTSFQFGTSVASFRAGSVTLPPLMSTISLTSVASELAMTLVLAALSPLMLPPPSWLPPGPAAWPRPAPCSPPT